METLVAGHEPAAESTEPDQPLKRPRRAGQVSAVGAVAGGAALIGGHAALYGNWVVDDAAITFAYARSVADGLGPVLQPGADPVEGYSNPTWLALLAIGRLVGLFDRGAIFGVPDYVLFPKALALLCCAGILAAVHLAAAKVTRRPWALTLLVGAALAVVPSFVIWSFSGLENSLYALSVAALASLLFRAVMDDRLLSPRVALYAGLLVALAALTRPDGIIYLDAYPLLVLFRLTRPMFAVSVRAVLISALACLVPYGAYVGWRLMVFGRLVANTAVAKGQEPPELESLSRVGELIGYGGGLAFLGWAVCVGIALAHPSRLRAALGGVLVPLGLSLLAFCVLAPDWMGELRFATPFWVLVALAGALALPTALRSVSARARLLLAAGLVLATLPSLAVFTTAGKTFRAAPTVPMCLVGEAFGRGVNGYADVLGLREASLLAPDLGATAMSTRLTLVDLAGLADAPIADFWHDKDWRGLRDHVFTEVKPTFIHMHAPWSAQTGLISDPRLETDYHVVVGVDDGVVGGDWVRKDAVPSQEALAALRAYANTVVRPAIQLQQAAPRGTCGPVLRPDQGPTPS
ncbi:hypothetical protein [Actinokineospora iranica]|uniref:Glycosyltransferase RgtA/B/C/D-like domain-containing protein n=1 Tax=Actinokineospora iranica TaxID=1271860 RepID=A0A1G6P6K5_9PSEU|nr:hypothetical protein [Actinokineospora iranica]SDC75638.1 hypothetical protein SAMN05216174_104138 [Actinokineospora iranica]